MYTYISNVRADVIYVHVCPAKTCTYIPARTRDNYRSLLQKSTLKEMIFCVFDAKTCTYIPAKTRDNYRSL